MICFLILNHLKMVTNIIVNASSKIYGPISEDILNKIKPNERIKLDNDLCVRLGTKEELDSQNLKHKS